MERSAIRGLRPKHESRIALHPGYEFAMSLRV